MRFFDWQCNFFLIYQRISSIIYVDSEERNPIEEKCFKTISLFLRNCKITLFTAYSTVLLNVVVHIGFYFLWPTTKSTASRCVAALRTFPALSPFTLDTLNCNVTSKIKAIRAVKAWCCNCLYI